MIDDYAASMYWAKFNKINETLFRFDTRIYLNNSIPSDDDVCIGAVVGKNPGSAKPENPDDDSLQPIKLSGDILLPSVHNAMKNAYLSIGKSIPGSGYVQVLNLFYLCENNLEFAIDAIEKISPPPICPSEKKIFPWIWYAWGNDLKLRRFKTRFHLIKTSRSFYYNGSNKTIKEGLPDVDVPAKHFQGLPIYKDKNVVPYLASLIR